MWFVVVDGNYTQVGLYNATSDKLTWPGYEKWLGNGSIEDLA